MNKNDSSKKAEALRRALEQINCAPNRLGLPASNERCAKDAIFEQRLSREDKRLLKDMGIAVSRARSPAYRIVIENVRFPDHPEPTRPGNYRSSCEECPDGGHSFRLPCSSITRDFAPGGKTCSDFKNSITSSWRSAGRASNALR